MPDIAISQVEYSNSNDGAIIHVFGRDKSGAHHRVNVTGFRSYFYTALDSPALLKSPMQAHPDMDTKYFSIRGEPVCRVYTDKPSDVRDIRERYKHYEADILYTTRFMIDMGITGGISVPDGQPTTDCNDVKPADVDAPSRVCILDIECKDDRGFPEPTRDAIICITCYDSFNENYTTFLYNPGECNIREKFRAGGLKNGCFRSGFHEVFAYKEEVKMLRAFAHFIESTNPDILTGWNFIQFDMPYIMGRMDHLGINVSTLARLPVFGGRMDTLRGRALFDLLEAYKKMHQQQKRSYRLDAIAFEEVGEQKVRYTGTLTNLWKTDPAALVEYNFKDVELCVAIEKKNNIIEFFREIARYVGMPLDKTLNSSSVVDTFILHKAHGKFVLPTKGGSVETEKFEGATVFPPVKGLHENVVVLDLASLYPMIMMTINASPETKDPKGELVAPNGVRFKKQPDGIVREIVTELLKERKYKKALRDKYKFGSREYKVYDMQQAVLKIVMNTYYGVSGYSRFRLFDREIGAAVTSVGRAILEHTRKVIEQEGYKVVSGDTDSVFILIPSLNKEETIREAKRLEALLNESYKKFAKEVLNADIQYFSTKFEKLYARFFSGGKKKRYAGLLVWKEGKDVNEVDIVGFETKRSDTPKLTQDVQKEIMGMILNGTEYSEIRAYMRGIVKKYRSGKYSLDEAGIPGGLSKSLDEYENDDAQLRGARYANEHLKTSFGKASKPKRVYIKQVIGPSIYPKTDVVCFEYADQVPSNFVVDWELMMEKTIQKPIERIVEALGWNWQDFDPRITTLSQWGM